MNWIIYVLAVVGFLSLVGTAGVLFAAWAFHNDTDEDASRRRGADSEGRSMSAQSQPIPRWLVALVVFAMILNSAVITMLLCFILN